MVSCNIVIAHELAELMVAVVKNPLSPVEHPRGVGVNCELFELGVERFVVSFFGTLAYSLIRRTADILFRLLRSRTSHF